jgi:gluconate 2-dehydrogenase gamma chain
MAERSLTRREALGLLASVPLASAFVSTPAEVAAAQQAVARSSGVFQPAFFTPNELDTVRILVDMILPRDERSGSATDARVPEFMDFMMVDRPERQVAMRGGLAWLDVECERRFHRRFADCIDQERRELLDEIAYPDRARAELSHGVEFFSGFRDLTATGFFTSQMGFEDLRYVGNTYVTEWTGCPPEALRILGFD